MTRLLIDLSSIAKTGLYEGKDAEFGREVEHEGKKVYVNGWQHGYERFVGYVTHIMSQYAVQPYQVIMVTDGLSSTARRKAIYPLYKGTRGTKPEIANVQFNLLKENLIRDFRAIGCHSVTQDGVEADDVLAFLAQNLEGNILVLSNDGDMAILINDRVSLIKGGTLLTTNPLGPFEIRHIPLYKALVGDASDNIKGAMGFGKKAWLDFLVWGGEQGPAALEGMVKRKTLHELVDDVAEFKPLRTIIDSAADVYAAYEVAQLHPEWCNTLRQPLQWSAGMVRGRDVVTDERLRPYAQSVRLITAENYDQAVKFLADKLRDSPIASLDLETSTPEESDDWLRDRDAEAKVDVFGSEITGCGLTFGSNGQYTYYFSVDHRDTLNITQEQLRDAVALIHKRIPCVVHNSSFELPICHAAWGDAWKTNGWGGFVPNVLDTKHLASYVDENKKLGLKALSAHYLGYEQETYGEVTTFDGEVGTLPSGGRQAKAWDVHKQVLEPVELSDPDTGEKYWGEQLVTVTDDAGEPIVERQMEQRQYKMNELTAQHVLSYGADDTICTSALFHFFKIIMEIEKTWDVMVEVEQLPPYVTALAFTQGTQFDLAAMKKMEKEDAATWEEHAEVLREFLIKVEWPGTVCPSYDATITPAQVKEMVQIVLGRELVTMVRTISKLATMIADLDHPDAETVAVFLKEGYYDRLNTLVKSRFKGAAKLDTDSPKQMKEFLYETLGLPVRIVGSSTPLERKNKPELAAAVSRHKKIWAGSTSEFPLSDGEKALLKQKAKTNEIAIAFALEMDQDNPNVGILTHIKAMKKCETRRKLYYETYARIRHWKDNKVHAQVNQNGTITRRFSSSDPNLQQLPKKGEGVKFRKCFVPHHRDAVICSIDFSGQELRQGAGMSMDANMLACFVGDNLKDMHSMTAAGAMEKKWGKAKLAGLIENFGEVDDSRDGYDLFLRLRKMKAQADIAKLADDLRKNAKNVNFGAQYDAMAPKLAETLIIPVADAQAFLDAKFAMFPRFEEWKEEVKAEASKLGYVKTCMGARRHLREALMSDEWGVADKALRQGPNFKIQGSSAEQTKLAMSRLWKSGILQRLDMVFFAPVHDELVWSVHKDHALESIKVIHQCMTVPYGNLPVPFWGSVSLGLNFGDQEETGDEATADPSLLDKVVPEILSKLFEKRVAE